MSAFPATFAPITKVLSDFHEKFASIAAGYVSIRRYY
jgi:hypothetical protein